MCRHDDPGLGSIDELLADPLIQLVMRADKVSREEIVVLCDDLKAARRILDDGKVRSADRMEICADEGSQYRSGVGVMLLNAANKVFVGKRIDLENAWQMPQGGIEPGERPYTAALRELREEIGTDEVALLAESRGWLRYELPHELIGKAWAGRWRGQQQKWLAMRFLGEDAGIDIRTEHPEFSDWRWVSPQVVADLVIGFKRPIYDDVLREFQPVYGDIPGS
jgi:putative (di)nucleoside polyphosphate hydrolase